MAQNDKKWIFRVKLITTATKTLQTYIWTFENSKDSGLWLSSGFDLIGGHGGIQIPLKLDKNDANSKNFSKICILV